MKDPCYSVSFRCYYHLLMSVAMTIICLLFLHRSITDIHGYFLCYSVPFRCYHILFAVRCYNNIVLAVFASEHHGYSRTLSVLFRAIPLLSYFV